jgi:hypothetical protein
VVVDYNISVVNLNTEVRSNIEQKIMIVARQERERERERERDIEEEKASQQQQQL